MKKKVFDMQHISHCKKKVIPYIQFFSLILKHNLQKWGKSMIFFYLQQSLFAICKVSNTKQSQYSFCNFYFFNMKENNYRKWSWKLLDINLKYMDITIINSPCPSLRVGSAPNPKRRTTIVKWPCLKNCINLVYIIHLCTSGHIYMRAKKHNLSWTDFFWGGGGIGRRLLIKTCNSLLN